MPSLSVLNILRTIKDRASVSRTELQHITSLSWGTITNTTRDLLNRNLIREEGALSTKAGRKPVRLAINPASHALIGVDLSPDILRCHALNLAGETLAYEELPLGPAEAPESVLERTSSLVQQILDLPIIAPRICLGIGLAVPGYLDEARETLRSAPQLPHWKNIPVRQILQDRLTPLVRLERDHNCLALAERWFGEAGNADDVLCLNLGEMIGLGILSAGEVFRGSQQRAGEFAHITLDPQGPLCSCGDHGCVASYATLTAVREFVRLAAKKPAAATPASQTPPQPTLAELSEAARQGDAPALAGFQRLGKYLGIGLANLIDLFNPRLIVLAGPLTAASDLFMPTLEKEIDTHASPASSRSLILSQLGERAIATGACGIVLQSVFEPAQTASPELQRA